MGTLQELLKDCYPSAKLNNRFDMSLQQFTGNDMIEFAIAIQQEQQKVIAQNAKIVKNGNSGSWMDASIDKSSIINEKNIIR